MKIKAIIIDDEEHGRFTLRKQLEWSCPQVEVIGEAGGISKGLELLSSQDADVVFLDIEMPGGSGFDLIQQLDRIDFAIIFTTAYDQYALEAFQVHAIDYLLKPIDSERLRKAVEKVSNKSENADYLKIERLINNNSFNSEHRKVAFPVSDGLEIVAVKDIIRCESDGAYCHVFINDRAPLFLSKTLKQIEELVNSDQMLRIHQSHLVNVAFIKKYIRGTGGQVILLDNTALPVSRAKKDDFLGQF